MEQSVEICIDVGGSGCKISAKKQSSTQLSPFIKFSNSQLFSSKLNYSQKVSEAIVEVLKRNLLPLLVSVVAISQTGNIDHDKNILTLSHRLQAAQTTGNPYGQFDIAQEIQKGLKKLINCTPKVVLINDSISGCLDPNFTERLVLTLTLGSYPVLGLCEKYPGHTQIHYKMIHDWTDKIILSNGKNIELSLKNQEIQKRNEPQNKELISEAIVKILSHYKQVFNWQPECFAIMGGNARFLKEQKEIQTKISHVKLLILDDYQEAIQSQMRGALFYAKNKKLVRIE